MKTMGFVFARGGSKGVPGKNVREVGGLSLLTRAVNVAFSMQEIDQVFVSTDCKNIAKIAEQSGAIVINRPKNLATDASPEWLSWQHAINWVMDQFGEFDRFVSLPATSPLRTAKDVRDCLDALTDCVDVVVTMTPSQRSPWFNMVRECKDGTIARIIDSSAVTRRQDVPSSFDMATVAYVSRPSFILKASRIWDGVIKGVVVPQSRALDIDTEFDLLVADLLLTNVTELKS